MGDETHVQDVGEDLIREGQEVTVVGLKSAPHLNGLRVRVLLWDKDSGRWQVEVGAEGVKALKPTNLLVDEPEQELGTLIRRCLTKSSQDETDENLEWEDPVLKMQESAENDREDPSELIWTYPPYAVSPEVYEEDELAEEEDEEREEEQEHAGPTAASDHEPASDQNANPRTARSRSCTRGADERKSEEDLSKLSVRDLKRRLDEKKVSFVGVTEKSELVALLQRVDAADSECGASTILPARSDWDASETPPAHQGCEASEKPSAHQGCEPSGKPPLPSSCDTSKKPTTARSGDSSAKLRAAPSRAVTSSKTSVKATPRTDLRERPKEPTSSRQKRARSLSRSPLARRPTLTRPRTQQEAAVQAEKLLCNTQLTASHFSGISKFVETHRLSDELELGLRMLSQGNVDFLISSQHVSKRIRAARDRDEAMLREIYDLAPEVEAIVSMLRSRRSSNRSRSRRREQVRASGRRDHERERKNDRVSGDRRSREEMRSWLSSLDGGRGAMLQYLENLEREFSSLGQLSMMTIASSMGSVVGRIDPAVYTALGIDAVGHRLLLAKGVLALSGQ